jgi:hypothetical protein
MVALHLGANYAHAGLGHVNHRTITTQLRPFVVQSCPVREPELSAPPTPRVFSQKVSISSVKTGRRYLVTNTRCVCSTDTLCRAAIGQVVSAPPYGVDVQMRNGCRIEPTPVAEPG